MFFCFPFFPWLSIPIYTIHAFFFKQHVNACHNLHWKCHTFSHHWDLGMLHGTGPSSLHTPFGTVGSGGREKIGFSVQAPVGWCWLVHLSTICPGILGEAVSETLGELGFCHWTTAWKDHLFNTRWRYGRISLWALNFRSKKGHWPGKWDGQVITLANDSNDII